MKKSEIISFPYFNISWIIYDYKALVNKMSYIDSAYEAIDIICGKQGKGKELLLLLLRARSIDHVSVYHYSQRYRTHISFLLV